MSIMRMSLVRVQHDGDEPNTLVGGGVIGPPFFEEAGSNRDRRSCRQW